jgi:hypothetical protein
MTVGILLLTCVLLTPWLVQFSRYIVKRPEAIPTPTWMVASSVLFLFLFPLVGAFFRGQRIDGFEQAAIRILITTILYWTTFTATYRLLSFKSRTVVPDGPRGVPTSFGVLKQAVATTSIKKAMVVFVPLSLVATYFARSSGIGISGGGSAMMDLPYHLVILRLMTAGGTTAFTALFAAHLFGKSSSTDKVLASGGIAVNLLFAVLAGRRPLLYSLVLFAFGVMWAGRRRQAFTMLLLGIAVWFLLFVFSPIFLRARTIWRSPNSPGVIAAFERALQEGAENQEAMDAASQENLEQRMNTYIFWLHFFEAYANESLGGALLIQAVIMTIPRAIAGFAKYAYGATEEDIFGTGDICNNVSLESYADLGLPGPIVYGVVFAIVFATIDWLIVWISRRNKYIALMAISAYFSFLLSPEADLMTYFGALRHTMILCVLTVPLVLMFGIKSVTGPVSKAPPGPLGASPRFVG